MGVSHVPVWGLYFSCMIYFPFICTLRCFLKGCICIHHKISSPGIQGFIPPGIRRCVFSLLLFMGLPVSMFLCVWRIFWSVLYRGSYTCIALSLFLVWYFTMSKVYVLSWIWYGCVLVWPGGMCCVNCIAMYNFDVLSLLPPGTNLHPPYTLPPNLGGVVALSLCTMYWIWPSLISWAHFSCVQQYFTLGIHFSLLLVVLLQRLWLLG